MMKVWLDDMHDDISSTSRHPPTGFVGSHSIYQIARWIKEGRVEHISFDHDLGGRSPFSGYILARYIEKMAWLKKIKSLSWDIHSANPIGASNIAKAMFSAERFWAEQ